MEKWKALEENNNYEISSYGNFRNKKGRMLRTNINARGYIYCNISTKNIITKVKIHRLVAKAFIDNPLDKETVNHIDGNKLNNRYSNLEWLTRKENIQHYFTNRNKKSV